MNILTRYGCLQSSADRVIRGRLDMPSRLSVTDGGLVAVLGVFGQELQCDRREGRRGLQRAAPAVSRRSGNDSSLCLIADRSLSNPRCVTVRFVARR